MTELLLALVCCRSCFARQGEQIIISLWLGTAVGRERGRDPAETKIIAFLKLYGGRGDSFDPIDHACIPCDLSRWSVILFVKRLILGRGGSRSQEVR